MEQDLWVRDPAEVPGEAHGVEEVAWAVRLQRDRVVFAYAPIAATKKDIEWESPATARVVRNAVR